jgi:hypothetical protein
MPPLSVMFRPLACGGDPGRRPPPQGLSRGGTVFVFPTQRVPRTKSRRDALVPLREPRRG